MKRGVALVGRGKTTEALAVAQELHAIRYSGAFEVQALALAREGSKDEAIQVLRQGLEAAPTSWLNGNLLGNYLSDEGRYEEAFAVYEEALSTPTADRVLIEANYSLALLRAGRLEEARAKVDSVPAQDVLKAESDTRKFFQSVLADINP